MSIDPVIFHIVMYTVNLEFFREDIIFANARFRENKTIAKSLCRLLLWVNHAQVANFYRDKYVFNIICENKILSKNLNLQNKYLWTILLLRIDIHGNGKPLNM